MDKGTSALESLMEILPFRLFPGQRGNKDWRRRRGKGEKLMYVETRFKGWGLDSALKSEGLILGGWDMALYLAGVVRPAYHF
jgi:hypothetical protein